MRKGIHGRQGVTDAQVTYGRGDIPSIEMISDRARAFTEDVFDDKNTHMNTSSPQRSVRFSL
jgi:hypothetical protein